MNKKDIQFHTLPDAPGIYMFRDSQNKILYVGKATSLRNRVRSYFSKNLLETRGNLLVKMLADASSVTCEQTDSVLEALILEANVIKKNQPPYNSRDKDNKSFNYIVITKEDFPRVLIVRGRELFSIWQEKDTKYIFGPFTAGGILKDALAIIRKIFPFRDTCSPCSTAKHTDNLDTTKKVGKEGKNIICKPCFNRQIGLCPGVCTGEITAKQYARTILHIKLLFEGKKKKLLASLENEMKSLAKAEKFEEAALLKGKIRALTHIRETALLGNEYKVSKGGDTGRLEAYDVAHISETHRVGVMTVIEDGRVKKSDYRKFIIRTKAHGDTAALTEIFRRRFDHDEWKLPTVLVIDGSTAQKNTALRVLREYGYHIPVITVVKNEKHKVGRIVGNQKLIEKYENDILLANSEAHRFAIAFHKHKRRKALTE